MQVSADARVSVPPGMATRFATEFTSAGVGVSTRGLPHVRPLPPHWRFDSEGAGTRVILVLPYAVEPAWVRLATREFTAWVLRRRAVRRVEQFVDALR